MPGLPSPPAGATEAERRHFYDRIHMPHRTCELAERFLLHPRIVDVLEALIGPDILGLQTMLFFKQPGQAGQGFHQRFLLHPDAARYLDRRLDGD